MSSRCGVIRDVINMKNIVWVICPWSSHIWCQIKPILKIAKLSKLTKLRDRSDLFRQIVTGNWICYLDSHDNFLHFEHLIDALTQILTTLLLFKTLIFFDVISDIVITIVNKHSHRAMVHLRIKFGDHILNHVRIIIKMCQFNFNMIIEGQLCRHFVTSVMTSSTWKYFFLNNLHMVFPYLMWNRGYISHFL